MLLLLRATQGVTIISKMIKEVSKKEIKVNNPVVVDTTTKRVCSKCKLPGHNAATCKDFHRKSATQPQIVETKLAPSVALVEKGQRTCSLCNEKGHNARTCTRKNK